MSIANAEELEKMIEAGRKAKGGKDGGEDGYESDESIASVVDADININRPANDPSHRVVVADGGANQPIVKKKLAHFQKQTEAEAEAERVAAGRRRRYSAPGNNVHSLLSFWKQKEQENVAAAAAGPVPKVKPGQVVVGTSGGAAGAGAGAGTGAGAGAASAWQQREKDEKDKADKEKAARAAAAATAAAQPKGVKWGAAATATVTAVPVPSAASAAAVSRATVVPAGPSNYAPLAGASVVHSSVAVRGVADYSSRPPEGVVETPAQIKARLKAEQLARDEKEKARAKQKGVKLTANEKGWLDELARKEKAERDAAEARIRAAAEAKRKAEEEAAAALAAKLQAEREAKERAEREAREAEERRLAVLAEAEAKEAARLAEEARLKAARAAAEEAERVRLEHERLAREQAERDAAEQKARDDAARLAAIADAEAQARERARQEEEARVEAERHAREAAEAEARRLADEQRKAEERKAEEEAERARHEAAKAAAAAAAEAEAKRAAEEAAAHAAAEAVRVAEAAAVEEARRAAAKRAAEEEERIRLEAERASRSSRMLFDAEKLRIETAALERAGRDRSGSTASLYSLASNDGGGSDTPTAPATPSAAAGTPSSSLAPPDLPSLPPPLPASLPPPMPPLPGLQPIGEANAGGNAVAAPGFVPPPISTVGVPNSPAPAGTPTTPSSAGTPTAAAGTPATTGTPGLAPKSILKSPSADAEKKPVQKAAAAVALTPEEEEKAKKKAEKDAAQRVLVRAELISTEESYVKSLSVLVEQFCHPLKKSDSFDIPQDDANAMFINVELLYNFHRVFLMDLSSKSSDLAKVVLKFADFLKMYTQYLNNYTKALETINAHRNNKKFQAFLEATRKRNGMDIMSYLIMPVQRIPRYELLLKEILRLTPEHHAEHGGLEQAYGKIQGIAVHINEEKRKVENMTKLCEIQNRISGDFGTLLQPHRRLVREGTLVKISHDLLSSQKQSQFFVFSDIVLWTTQTHKYRGHLELTGLTCVAYKDAKKGKHGFQIAAPVTSDTPKRKHREETFLCAAGDEKEASTWIADIHDAIKSLAADQQKVYARRAEERERRGASGSVRQRVASTGGGDSGAMHSLIKQSLTDLKSLRGHDAIHSPSGAAAAGGGGVASPGAPVVPEPLLDIVASVQHPAAAGGAGGSDDLKTPPAARPKHRRSVTSGALSPNA